MKWTKQRLNNLFFFLGCAACVVMLFTFDVSFVELWEHITHAGYWLIPIIGIWLVVYGLNALAWRAIILGNCKDHEITDGKSSNGKSSNSKLSNSKFFWRIYQLTITGYALNYATPVGGLGGEPYRIMELSKDIDNQHATSSVILYAMMHFFAHFWFLFISIFIYLALVLVGDMPITVAIGTILGIIVVFCLIAFYIFSRGYRHGLVIYVLGLIAKIPGLKGWSTRFQQRHAEALQNIDAQIAALYHQDTRAFYIFSRGYRHGLVVYVLGLIGKIPFLKGWSRRFRGNHAEALRNIDAQISALYHQDTRAFYTSLVLEYASRMVQSLEVMFMLLLFGIDCGGGFDGLLLTYLHSVLIVAFTTLFANLIGFLPMQIGVQEGGFVLSIAALGLSAALGIFVSIICRVREIIWIAIGMLLMKIR